MTMLESANAENYLDAVENDEVEMFDSNGRSETLESNDEVETFGSNDEVPV